VPEIAAEKAGEAPDIPAQHTTWLNAYMELATCRTERGVIPWDSVAHYAEVYDLPLETLRRIVRRVDFVVMADQNKKNEKLIKKKPR